jgi:membrane-associated protease RseP (regulator of RpoE activity)
MPDRPAAVPSRPSLLASFRLARLDRATISSWARRLTYFWIVWSALLFVHEGGHAMSAWRQGLTVRDVTVGMGPVIGRAQFRETEIVLRLVPVAGMTNIQGPRPGANASDTSAESADAAATGATGTGSMGTTTASSDGATAGHDPHGWHAWRAGLVTLLGGITATLAFGIVMAAIVFVRERTSGRRWLFGRFVVADAVVLTVFNFFPVPPLDGGRAVLGTFAAWHGAPLSGDALFWVQAGGMALAVVPMTLWTRWTARIDRVAAHWRSPRPR